MSNIKSLWDEFSSQPFPDDIAGKEIEGVCLTTVDSFTVGCVSTFIQDKRLDSERVRILKDCLEDLEKVISELKDSNRNYFMKLQALGNAVLEEIEGAC